MPHPSWTLLALTLAAAAPTRPLLTPSRDVTVDYVVQAQDRPAQTLQVAFGGGGTLLRATLSDGPGALLLDRSTHRALLVLDAERMVIPVPGGGREIDDFLLNDRMQFERLGAEELQGLACTDWRVRSDRGVASACVTADGVILKGEGHDQHDRRGTLTATRVRYGKLPPGTFQPPQGYNELRLPHGLKGLLQPGSP